MNNTMDIVTEYGIGPDFFEYIESHKSCDTAKLLLASKKPGPAFDLKFAILQIECRKRISRKVPELAGMPHFIFPSALSTEQCTCQPVAQFHASLLDGCANVLDLTAGLGIDDYYIAGKTGHLTAVEKNPLTASALKYNMIEKSGSWYSYNGEKVGQGRDKTIEYFENNPDLVNEIVASLREKMFPKKADENGSQEKGRE